MKKFVYLVGLTLLLGLLPLIVQGQEATGRSLLHFQVATFDPVLDGEPAAVVGDTNLVTVGDERYYIVQFNGLIEAAWIVQAEQLGAEPLGYIPDNAYLLRIEPDDVEKIASIESVRWIGPYYPGYKLAPSLSQQTGTLRGNDGTVEVRVVAFPGETIATVKDHLRAVGATISTVTTTDLGPVFRATVPVEALTEVARLSGISWIEPFTVPQVTNSEARRVINAESLWTDYGYFGAGQIVAISDSGLSVQGALSADFDGRLRRGFSPSEMNLSSAECRAKTTWTDLHGHGTHVAGSVLGNGTNSGSDASTHQYTSSFAGVAPEAELVFMALNTDGSNSIQCVDDNGDFLDKGYQEGARISSNSWGASTYGAYDFTASVVDNYIWNHKDYLVLFAAGNEGPYRDSIGSPGVAKNILSVGATENNRPDVGQLDPTTNIADNPDEMASFSSRGPTDDQRVKPDLVAPGTFILSTRAAQAPDDSFWENYDSNYAYMGGTSMATPLTAGAAALVREWVAEKHNLSNPSAALLKALMIHGAAQLPASTTPNFDSGWGRVDLKNTISARYALFDDHVEGLVTGETISYTVEMVGSTALGTLFAGDLATARQADVPLTSTITLVTTPPLQSMVEPAENPFTVEPIPGFDAPAEAASISTTTANEKTGLTPVEGQLLSRPTQVTASVTPRPVSANPAPQSLLQGMVGGGDFEDPDWTTIWSKVWLGYGIPVRSRSVALDGEYSIWMGGTPIEDAILYPLSFPATIDSDFPSYLSFLFQMRNLDPEDDIFCAALIDTAGYLIGDIEDCYDAEEPETTFAYSRTFTAAEKAALAGQTGYLVMAMFGDASEPHLSTYVDNIVLAIDFDDVTLTATPSAGPPGTTFLLTGSNNVPYGSVDVCMTACNSTENYLGTVYADARGDVAAYLRTSATGSPGTYVIATENVAGRTATTTITLVEQGQPTLTVAPTAGPAGTTFVFSGTNFLPNDPVIAVSVNGSFVGAAGSDASGAIGFSLRTSSNILPGTYTVEAVDSADRSASVTFEVTEVPSDSPTLSVTPTSGPAGTDFTFTGKNFTPHAFVNFSLDGQPVGQTRANGSGGFVVRLETSSTIAPGSYTLVASQGSLQASASFEITGTGGDPETGSGLYVTLVWTDPPAQVGTSKALINNLDLRVITPDGTTVYSNGGSSTDQKNTVETVRLTDPAPGTYTIVVEAQQVISTYGSQPFALVATTRQNAGTDSTKVRIIADRLYLPLLSK